MKQFKVTAKFEDTIAIVNADNEEEAQEKYWDGEIEEWEQIAEQADIEIEEIR